MPGFLLLGPPAIGALSLTPFLVGRVTLILTSLLEDLEKDMGLKRYDA